jgi:hypothetical protein
VPLQQAHIYAQQIIVKTMDQCIARMVKAPVSSLAIQPVKQDFALPDALHQSIMHAVALSRTAP